MWIKKTNEEIKRSKRWIWLKFLGACFTGSIILSPFLTLTYGWYEGAITGEFAAPKEQWAERLPSSLLFGFIVGGLAFIFEHRVPAAMVCTRCESVKKYDANSTCSCGGTYENIKLLKWVEIPKPESEKINCLQCGNQLQNNEYQCPQCGWSYK